ncbi:dgd1 suppressor 1 [Actinidia rufa]|uniref:Dgd1 suppressor 1 n=1 Tax=Actinidia rufa TaxID=165716 RepID=A0A7J0E1X9_9ERIC|nr:dgd1 suppressor 1 [Actinidia rufa]
MLLAFTEQTKGEKVPENASDQEMLETVMARYEKELTKPNQEFGWGRACSCFTYPGSEA